MNPINTLLSLPVLTLMELWGELLEAYHGVNGYGSNVAEIYAYRFQRYNPDAHSQHPTTNGLHQLREMALQANRMLVELCALFAEYYECSIYINDHHLDDWSLDYEFNHRLHVTVEPK